MRNDPRKHPRPNHLRIFSFLQKVEVPMMLRLLRSKGCLWIQTIAQYKFVYQVLIQFLQTPDSFNPCIPDGSSWKRGPAPSHGWGNTSRQHLFLSRVQMAGAGRGRADLPWKGAKITSKHCVLFYYEIIYFFLPSDNFFVNHPNSVFTII